MEPMPITRMFKVPFREVYADTRLVWLKSCFVCAWATLRHRLGLNNLKSKFKRTRIAPVFGFAKFNDAGNTCFIIGFWFWALYIKKSS